MLNSYMTENLEIYENTNGQILVKNITVMTINVIEDLYKFLESAVRINIYFLFYFYNLKV